MRVPSVALAAVAGALVSVACGAGSEGHREEGALIDTRDNVLEQGLFDCTESADTGYTQGNAFTIEVVTVDNKPVEVDTANAYIVMQEAAAADGVALRIVSGFRTMSQQEYLYGCYVDCNCNNCNLAAQPGYSNHQSGHALDLNTSDAGVLTWLNNHGAAFGFERTVPSEAWHWEWWGGGPGGGPCGASPECLDNPNFGGCEGTVITSCDDSNHLGTGDCGFFGAACSTEGGAPHCVHPYCTINLAGGESGTFCADDTKLATCDLGQYSEGDCAAYGGICSDQGGGHCVHFMCWSNLDGGEDGSFCVDDKKLGSCALGAFSESACPSNDHCSEVGGAHCVDARCAPLGDADGSFCADSAVLGSCARGVFSERACGDGCVGEAGSALCAEDALPEPPDPADKPRYALPPSVSDGCAQTRGAPVALLALFLLLRTRTRVPRQRHDKHNE